MRVVLVSTHIDQTTGYSKVSYNLLRQMASLSPKVKTFHFGFQRHPSRAGIRKYPDGIVPYDAAANEDPKEEGFGFNKIHEYLEMVQPDLVMIYNDPLIIYRFIEAMKHDKMKSPYKLWLYVDQVYEGIADPLVTMMNEHADRIFCFSDTWKQIYSRYNSASELNVLGHSVDTSVFTRLPADARMSQRASMGIPPNARIFLNANRNSQRKRLDLTIAGFVKLLSRRPDAPYYLMIVTNINPQSGAYYDVQRIFMEELKTHNMMDANYMSRLLLVDSAPPNTIDDEGINKIYNITDVGVNTSDGEGFGLCQLEHMYVGAPQVVTDIGTYRSFMDESVGEFIPRGDRYYFTGSMPLGGWAYTFSIESVADAMQRAMDTLDEKRAKLATATFPSWSRVCDKFLEDLLTM
jgi:glycosyltransferase involved in cell wall biosynthesis